MSNYLKHTLGLWNDLSSKIDFKLDAKLIDKLCDEFRRKKLAGLGLGVKRALAERWYE